MATDLAPEILTPYVDRQRDRFVVALVLGMPEVTGLATLEQALEIARSLR